MAPKKQVEDLTEEDIAQFDWLTLRKEMDSLIPTETRKEKFIRKFSENPLVPIGCLATTAALVVGLWSFKKGERKLSQYMMRTRIAAQGFTVLAMVMGIAAGAKTIIPDAKNSNAVKNKD